MATKSGKESQNVGSPNQTLYLKNLPEKLNKNELKRALYMLFSTYGPVLDIVTARVGAKGQSMRGKAHVVFRDIQTSTQAMRALQGSEFFGKEMNIVYAKGVSNIIPKLRGTFETPTAATATSETTALQKSVFNAPPAAIASRPTENGVESIESGLNGAPHGTKRPREEEEDEQEESDNEVEMEEDDDDAPMEEDDDD